MTRIRTILAALALTLGVAAASAGPASAQARQEGLVNVYAEDVTVQVPVGVAANVCGVAANVLAQAGNFGDVDCASEGVAVAQDSDPNNPPPRQRGLVNLALVDVTVQVPVAVAADVCGVAVNVLANNVNAGAVDCDAIADASAGS